MLFSVLRAGGWAAGGGLRQPPQDGPHQPDSPGIRAGVSQESPPGILPDQSPSPVTS